MPGHPVPARDPVWWSGGLDPLHPRPLVVVVGGAFGGRAEYLRLLTRLVRRGNAVLAAALPLATGSARPLTGLLDRHSRDALTGHTTVIGFDLGGRLALRAAGTDPRIREVQLVGAPVLRLFTEPDRLLALPRPILAALRRAAGVSASDLLPWMFEGLQLSAEELFEVRAAVRVGYRPADPLTPPQDLALLRLALDRAEFHAFRGGRGSPAEPEIRRWLTARTAGCPLL